MGCEHPAIALQKVIHFSCKLAYLLGVGSDLGMQCFGKEFEEHDVWFTCAEFKTLIGENPFVRPIFIANTMAKNVIVRIFETGIGRRKFLEIVEPGKEFNFLLVSLPMMLRENFDKLVTGHI